MSDDLEGITYEEFLKKEAEPKPPTEAEIVLATYNFSSRVDPPKEVT